ncbi:phosphotransferase family protein [Rhodobacter sp. HX-7-19]|uniref:Phosphotransferase family protein n=1 Tax=Paragemmobacter kunshanensis TaxID=2583234 RepID=A0A6M1U859_9RHOB|nr:choline/ethanolamine kinase family protein [Rhodobacter kunshanensis]NGQ92735.1 phosphotransferase family protein [Rhodobacter kunshanensis]
MTDDIAAIAARIPALQGFTGTPRRLGGLTNRVWHLGGHVLRIPGEGTAEYIDRTNEATAARAAAAAGVSPEVLHADPASGLMVTRFIPDTVTMTPDLFRSRPGSPARAARELRQLHDSGVIFPARFDLFAMIDDYRALLAGKSVAPPEGYDAALREADRVRTALAAHPLPQAPCHCDPLCENFLDTGSRMWIVDWEYSGMNDPMWDLGDLSVEAGFDAAQDAAMLTAYFGRPAGPWEEARMIAYKAMCDLLWTLWGLIQHANGNPADDFLAYATGRFQRCRALMSSPDFAARMESLHRGG